MTKGDIVKLRIIEETSIFKNGSRAVVFRLQSQYANEPDEWHDLGTFRTLEDARKSLLRHTPDNGLWLS